MKQAYEFHGLYGAVSEQGEVRHEAEYPGDAVWSGCVRGPAAQRVDFGRAVAPMQAAPKTALPDGVGESAVVIGQPIQDGRK